MGEDQLAFFVDLDAEIDKILFTTGHQHAADSGIVQRQAGLPIQKPDPVITRRHFDTGAVVKVEPNAWLAAVLRDRPGIKTHIWFDSRADTGTTVAVRSAGVITADDDTVFITVTRFDRRRLRHNAGQLCRVC